MRRRAFLGTVGTGFGAGLAGCGYAYGTGDRRGQGWFTLESGGRPDTFTQFGDRLIASRIGPVETDAGTVEGTELQSVDPDGFETGPSYVHPTPAELSAVDGRLYLLDETGRLVSLTIDDGFEPRWQAAFETRPAVELEPDTVAAIREDSVFSVGSGFDGRLVRLDGDVTLDVGTGIDGDLFLFDGDPTFDLGGSLDGRVYVFDPGNRLVSMSTDDGLETEWQATFETRPDITVTDETIYVNAEGAVLGVRDGEARWESISSEPRFMALEPDGGQRWELDERFISVGADADHVYGIDSGRKFTAIDADDGTVAWTSGGSGRGTVRSGPIEEIFGQVGDTVLVDRTEELIAHHVDDGDPVWRVDSPEDEGFDAAWRLAELVVFESDFGFHATDGEGEVWQVPGAHSSLRVGDIGFLWGRTSVLALDLAASRRLWQLDTGGRPHLADDSGMVFFDLGTGALAVNTETGDRLWRTERGGDPLVVGDRRLVVFDTDSGVLAVDLESGRELWDYHRLVRGFEIAIPAPEGVYAAHSGTVPRIEGEGDPAAVHRFDADGHHWRTELPEVDGESLVGGWLDGQQVVFCFDSGQTWALQRVDQDRTGLV